jgi:hypothetical protein
MNIILCVCCLIVVCCFCAIIWIVIDTLKDIKKDSFEVY